MPNSTRGSPAPLPSPQRGEEAHRVRSWFIDSHTTKGTLLGLERFPIRLNRSSVMAALRRGHPRLALQREKAWVRGTSPRMTVSTISGNALIDAYGSSIINRFCDSML